MKETKITYHPTGTIYTLLKEINTVPIQPRDAKGVKGVVELNYASRFDAVEDERIDWLSNTI